MMIQWFEDKINFAIPPTEENLARLSRYAQVYADCGQVGASLACVLCRLVVECKARGSSVYGALQAYTGEVGRKYYLPDLPLSHYEYKDLNEFLEVIKISDDLPLLTSLGNDLCAIFPLARRLQVDPDLLPLVAILVAEVLMGKAEEEVQVPIEIDLEQVRLMFGL